MSSARRLVVSEDGPVSVVRFVDRKIVDSSHIEELGGELNALVTEENRTMLLLNFEGVDFLSSAALNKLIAVNNKARQAGGLLKLCNLRAEIMEVFKITNLDRLFEICKTEAVALESFRV